MENALETAAAEEMRNDSGTINQYTIMSNVLESVDYCDLSLCCISGK